jgi:mannitol-1-phosphate 5-dehydrogenase
MPDRPTVVQFGAGAIGRGFVGQLWHDSGFHVGFVDVDPGLVSLLNRRNAYELRLTDGETTWQRRIDGVHAAEARDTGTVVDWLTACDLACTAVGVNAFRSLAPTLALGIARRSREYAEESWEDHPFNVICCENQAKAGALMRSAVAEHITAEPRARAYFEGWTGFVDASVGRMVPPPTPELLAEDPLLILAEPYDRLPIDAAAWRGKWPTLCGVAPTDNFTAYVARKLFTHNGGHALLAYEGYLEGRTCLSECAEDSGLIRELAGYWEETGDALIAAYGLDAQEQRAHEADLLRRFRNKALGDTVARVARDPARKLRGDDRLVGAAILCLDNGITPVHVARAIAAALRYDAPDDPTAGQVRAAVARSGVRGALTALSGVGADSPLADLVEEAYNGRRG